MRALLSVLLLGLITFSTPSLALFGKDQFNNSQNNSFGSSSDSFVPVDQAFPFNFYQQDDKLMLDWQVRDGYYLYQERLSVAGEKVSLGELQMEDGTPHKDEFFGDVHIYTQPLFVNVPMYDWQDGARVVVQYQGCAKAGFCYPPETRVIPISAFTSSNSDSTTATTASKAEQAPTATPPAVQSSSSADTPSAPVTQQDSLAANLADNWWTPLLFLALGVGLAFTPCVLPMYPILTSIVLGSGKLSQRRALGLSFVYVQGMALTYTLLGLVVASAGMQFQAAMQHPYVLIGLSVLFIALALSMFGLYSLQLPSSVQTWLNNLSNKQQGGSSAGVFAMGAISGLVCSPCTTAPLSGALLYVAQSGDLLTGGIALYALAMGMGIPLILVAVFGNKLLPKAGGWMDRVKTLFGFILLAAPIFLLERIMPEMWSTILWSALGIAAFGWLYHIKNSLEFGGWKQSAVGIIAVLGLLASAQPILNYWFGNNTTQTQQATVSFTRIANVAELEEQLALAKAAGKPVMLDFYADWCVACKEFEKYTFHDPSVEAKLQDFVLLQADVTKNQVQDIELLKHMNVLGLPTIEFWDASGEHVSNARLTGFMQAEPFLEHIKQF
ncbi:Thiol:disulfide interchange protein DsbD precursor [Vibrio alginolyticus]|uniref:Thiol:disulfide interchange protein DsbD n=1 Tax=Vibrio alginolyticus TaxID=663 RepID=A0A1W6UPK4_VIBAL|nr:protein-disulfide reductase DsbD [Vibrio alginolyticus]ARO99867.1 Thiol:disulfide interchange protein DsbD precursor [Vibrio alginolyticus]ARP04583.1 Thiol:disulfide interchange protein DsbD precursor [Vibrio alginolyticus]ARP09640.1 Thiol:disulfide interchange protein DsbD precursor [Vibrio alginolyticus]ARP14718.1 Thiol:disulfide interchange protein DsbD precursor [Vibrio alginolyticus]ARP19777.1 Thiol:disulfide interchange protein DsbD precursor [Vibrio alginolyticus]